ncbi:MAG: phage tail protein [Gammaproteobacteria bacterium]|nr:phage tail protein [Gammaproteobacteria bacterium]
MKSSFAVAIITTFALLSLALPVLGQPRVADSAPASASGLPVGVIVMWSGSLDSIPAGWSLCDGRDGTPDLSNRFVLGAGADEYLGNIGGSRTHQHRTRDHIHQIDPPALRLHPAYGYSGYGGAGARERYYTIREQTLDMRPFKSGPTTAKPDSVQHLPPYYKIAFIMKL